MICPTPEQYNAAKDGGVDVEALGLAIEHAVQRGIEAAHKGTDAPLTSKGIAFESLSEALAACGYEVDA